MAGESPKRYLMTVRPAQVYLSAGVVHTRVDLEGANGHLSVAEGTPSREVLFFIIPSYPPIFANLDIFNLQMCPFGPIRRDYFRPSCGVFAAYEYGCCVTSLPGLLSNRVRGRANGKIVALAQTAGRTMLKVWAFPHKGIITSEPSVIVQLGSLNRKNGCYVKFRHVFLKINVPVSLFVCGGSLTSGQLVKGSFPVS